jgi:ABC-type phosphate transport system substrate-binding protein
MLFLILLLAQTGGLKPASTPIQVIVNRESSVSSIPRAEVSAIFMKRVRGWEPVEQSSLRDAFSKQIHGKSSAYVTRYWQRLIFAGRGIPPRELPSDEAVLEFVKANRGAIGYVTSGAATDGVKVIVVTK